MAGGRWNAEEVLEHQRLLRQTQQQDEVQQGELVHATSQSSHSQLQKLPPLQDLEKSPRASPLASLDRCNFQADSMPADADDALTTCDEARGQ